MATAQENIPLHLLKLANYEDPILRKVCNTVSFPLSEEDKKIEKIASPGNHNCFWDLAFTSTYSYLR